MDDRDFDNRLRQRLRAYESRLPETDAPDPRDIRPRAGIRWPAIAGVFGAAAILGAVGGATVLLNRSAQPIGSDAPTASATHQSTEPSPTGWGLELLPDARGPVQISDVALLSDGRAVVVGADAGDGGDRLEPAAWYDDGAGNWRRAEIAGSTDAGDFPSAYQLGPMVVTDDGLVSIGISEGGAAIYASSDSGASWSRQFAIGDLVSESGGGIAGIVLDIERGPSGFVAVGHLEVPENRVGSAAMIWTSADALHWVPAGDALGVGAIAPGIISDVAFRDGTFLAVGSTWDEEGAHPQAGVWASNDGRNWGQVATRLGDVAASSVIGASDGFLLGGAVSDAVKGGLAASWFSSNGEQWESAAMTAGQARMVSSFASIASGFIAIGDRMDHAEAWASADGRSWSRLPDLPTQGRSAAMAVAASETVILAAGTVEPNAAPRQPVVWRMSTDEVDSAAPTTAPVPTATAAASPTSLRIAWDTDPMPLDIAWIDGVVADGGRIFALGEDGSSTALILSSDDGLRWQRAELPFPATWAKEPPVFHVASHIVATDDRLLAFGTVGAADFLNVVVWQSTDGGRSWSEVSTGDFMVDGYRVLDATAGPTGVVVATHGYGAGTGSVWRSTDAGPTWTEVRPSGEQLELQAVVGTASGYVLVGSECDETSCAVRHPRIWTSVDGASWTPSSVEARDSTGEVERVTVNGSGTFVAIGTLEDRKVVWTSRDTETWSLSADLGSMSPSAPSGLLLAGLPDGFIAIDTMAPGHLITWTSSDGVGWFAQDSPLPSLDGVQVQSFGDGIARLGDRVVLAGPLDPNAEGGRFSWVGHIEH